MSVGLAEDRDKAAKASGSTGTGKAKESGSTTMMMDGATRDRLVTLSASFWGTGWATGLGFGWLLVFVLNSLLTTPGSGLSNLVAILKGESSVLLSQELASWGVSGLFFHYILLLWTFQITFWVVENVRAVLGIRGTWTFSKETEAAIAKDESPPTFCSRAHAFWYDTTEGPYENAKTAIFICSGLAPMRMVLGVTGFCLGCISCGISGLKPFGPIGFLNDLWYYCWACSTQFWTASIMFWLSYYHWGFEGQFDTTAKILVSNHPCVLEAVMAFEISGLASFVSKIENNNLPFFPLVTKACQAILTVRKSKDSRQQAIDQINERARSTDRHVKQLLIFPEATTGNNRCLIKFKKGAFIPGCANPKFSSSPQCLIKFKKGAFIPGCAIQPICFRYPYTNFNQCACHCTNRPDSLGKTMLRSACQFVNRVEIKVLPKYEPNDEEKKDPEVFAENVRQLMSQHIELPCADVSFEDYLEEERKYNEALKEAEGKKDK